MQRTEINQSITLNRGDCSVFMGPRRLTSGWSSLEVLLWGVIGFVNELIKWRGVTCPGRPVESSFLSLKGDSGACWRKFVLHQLNHRSLSSTTSLSNWYSSTFFPLLSRDYCGQVSDCCCSFAGRRSSVLNTDMTTPKNKHFFTTKGPALHFVKLLWPVSKFKSWRIILVSRAVSFFFLLAEPKLLSALLNYFQVASLCLSTGYISAAWSTHTYIKHSLVLESMNAYMNGGSTLVLTASRWTPLSVS